jgi:hypothetical protein
MLGTIVETPVPASVLWFNSQDTKVAQGSLDHIKDLIVAPRVRGFHEETCLHQEVNRILNDTLQTLVVMELNAHPQAPDGRLFVKEFDLAVILVSFKALYEEQRLERIERYRNHLIRVDTVKFYGAAERGIGFRKEILQAAWFDVLEITFNQASTTQSGDDSELSFIGF